MKIREYAKLVGFTIVGKLTYGGKWDLSHRFYVDAAGNVFIRDIDVDLGGIRIVPRASLISYRANGR